jgi:hypothetical protein
MNGLRDTEIADVRDIVAAERRQQERIPTCIPLRIVAINGKAAGYDAVCRNLSHGGIAFDSGAALDVGKIIEFEFIHAIDQPCRYYSRILYRHGESYGAYYVNDDCSDIRPQN